MRLARWQKALVSLGALVVAALAAELGHRAWLASRGAGYSASRTRQQVAALVAQARDYAPPRAAQREWIPERQVAHDELHPFFAFQRETEPVQVERDLADQQRRPDDLRLLVLGGSVAAIFCSQGTARLLELLEADPALEGRRIRLLRYARAGFKQPQQLTVLCYLLSVGLAPDVVLAIDGYNELAIGADNFESGFHPVYPNHRKWMALTAETAGAGDLPARRRLEELQRAFLQQAESWERSPLLASSILGGLARSRLEASRGEWTREQAAYVESLAAGAVPPGRRGPAFAGDEPAAIAYLAGLWKDSSRSVRALCEARGIRYLHVLQPALHDSGSKPPREDELAAAQVPPIWERSVREGYPLLRAAGAELSAEGERFLDASRVFAEVEERLYDDACHFGERGNALLAELIAPALLELLREPPR